MEESAKRPAEPIAADDPRTLALRRLVGVVDRLREPDGCPWDREQTEESMAPSLIEEAHELVEAIEQGSAEECAEEAGDVLMNVLLISRIAMEAGRYDLARAADLCSEKLVRRHPHVFGEVEVEDSEGVLVSWEAIKKAERAEKEADTSALAGLPVALPALQRAARACGKAVSAGFHWQDVGGALAKVREELAELEAELPAEALAAERKPELAPEVRERVEAELGDLLLAGAFLGKYLGIDPERATRESLRRFEARFRSMEEELGGDLSGLGLSELMQAWGAAKARLG